ncbi:MAG: ABC transporter ATP-binding protein/permease [Lachnospiraceae bacterium]|nr:ABC transporter ATP-binding protein/permease [Lachnospiraceae bacterium]
MSDENKTRSSASGQGIPGHTRHDRFAEAEHAENVGATLKRIIAYFVKEKAMVIAMLAVVLFGTLCGVYAPSLQSNAIDIIAGERDGVLLSTVLFMLTVYLLYSLCSLLQSLISAKLSQNIVGRMRNDFFGKVMDLPVSYLDQHSHGDVMSRMTNDIENISTTVSQSLPSLFSGVMTIIGTAAIMLWYCWQLALLSCATVILTVIATKVLSKQVRRFSRRRQELLGDLNGTVEEMISGYRTVVAYNHQDITTEHFCETADAMTKAGIRTDIFSGVMGPIMNCIGNIGFVIIAAFGGYFSIHGMISVGVISAFIVYAKQFSRPINEIAQVYGQLQTAIAGAERVFVVMDEEDEDPSGEELKLEIEAAEIKQETAATEEYESRKKKNATEIQVSERKITDNESPVSVQKTSGTEGQISDTEGQVSVRKVSDAGKLTMEEETDHAPVQYEGKPVRAKATVTFDHVYFSYEPGYPVIRDFSLTVPSGKKVALVGATGSGKTTVVNLMMRFYDIDSGAIRINDQNLKDIARASLRKNVAIVLQDTVLFSNTVRSNLKYGNENATDEDLARAVRMSRCEEMIRMLPQGYETVLTGSGENISQGQRQLLAIARAFVMDPEILILDEATSNVDTRTEKAIQDAMQLVMQNRTSIVIAHRLSTIRDSDVIVVMDHGEIAESGSHEELLAKKGKYYELYMTQYAGIAT